MTMESPYADQILDLLSDGNERTVEEIRTAIGATPQARIHKVLARLQTTLTINRDTFRLRSRRVTGKLYYCVRRAGAQRGGE